MRALWLASFILALAAAPLPTAHAQAELLTDNAADVTMDVGGAPQPAPDDDDTKQMDLLGLSVSESDDALTFTLKTAKSPAIASRVLFTWHESEYALEYDQWFNGIRIMGVPVGESDVQVVACLLSLQGEDESYVDCFEGVEDAAAGTVAVAVPKVDILDRLDRMPLKGDALENIRVESDSGFTIVNTPAGRVGLTYHDAMPDDESGAASYVLQKGDEAAGHLALASDERIRVSNGGATTFVYRVDVVNRGDAPDDVDLAFADMPADWKGTVQSPVRLGPKEDKTVAVLVSVPFAHEHGGYSSFNLTATSKSDAGSAARMRMGVLHTPIPQPAGHHADLYLHAQSETPPLPVWPFGWTWGTMNTESAHDGDAPELGPNNWNENGQGWWIDLNPSLRMGLDFQMENVGTLVGSVLGRSIGEATMSAQLVLYSFAGGDWSETTLAEADSVGVTLDLQTPTPFALTLVPTAEADYVAHAADQNLALVLTLDNGDFRMPSFGGMSQAEPALLVSEFKMTLPLDEYHDKLTGEAEAASAITLDALGPVEKAGAPGATLTYAFQLSGAQGDYAVEVAGGDAALGEVAPDGVVSLDGARELVLAVHIPAESAPGEELEVLVYVYDQIDPTRMAIARTKTTVSTGADAVADESQVFAAAKDANKDTPAAGFAVGLLALAAAALAMRRR